jgi:GNAT superfamily N-acetyltransferase
MPSDAQRACDWHHRVHDLICDEIEPWEGGVVARASRYPTYFDYNVVRVTGDPGLGAAELIAFADERLDGLGHRRVDFDDRDAAEARAADFAAAGWDVHRWVVMRFEGPPPPHEPDVVAADYDVALPLRMAWLREDFPDLAFGGFADVAREVAMRLGTETFAIHGDDGAAIAFTDIERGGSSAEVSRVYVDAARRGGGMGTRLTLAAVHAAGAVDDLWILADDEGRPKELYARLGFREVWRTVKFQRIVS